MPLDVNQPPPFNIAADPANVAQRWKLWKKTFTIYITATGVTNTTQMRALLPHVGGVDILEVLETLPGPIDTLQQALTALDNYFSPKENKRYERFKFKQLTQETSESTDSYVTKLRKLASTCAFTDIDDVIIDQVIEKCASSKLRRKLLETDDLTLDKLLTLARAMELSDAQASVIEKRSQSGSKEIAAVSQHYQKNFHHKGPRPKEQHRPREQGSLTTGKLQQSSHNNNNNSSKYNNYKNRGPGGGKPKFSGGHNQARPPGPCQRCGNNGHHESDYYQCPATGKMCSKCSRHGHFPKMCRSDQKFSPKNIHCVPETTTTEETENNNEDFVFQLNTLGKSNGTRIYVDVSLNNTVVSMQVDSGADMTVIPEDLLPEIPNLIVNPSKSSDKLKDYNNADVKVKGFTTVKVQYRGKTHEKLPLRVVEKGRKPLLGSDWIDILMPEVMEYFRLNKVSNQTHNLDALLYKYKEVFDDDKLGKVKNITASLALKPDAVPKFFAFRQPPYALKPLIEQEIKRLEVNDIWEKVTYSDWATPLVPVVKEDNSIRICGDYKITVNPQLLVAQHPLPRPSDMFAAMGGCTVFAKIDLKQAFQQLEMDERSQHICTLNTPLGLYKPKRLPYGIASSPALWQQTMDKIFNGMEHVFVFVDDILCAGKDEEDLLKTLEAVLKRLLEHGLKLKENKCSFMVKSVEYLGFKIDGDGIHKTDDKLKAVKNLKVPSKVEELQAFLGFVTFYGKFIPNLATTASPLFDLLKKNAEWVWSDDCQHAFESIKLELLSPRFLTHFQPELPVKLICDASSVGVGAVLGHVMPDGVERPIAFASRALNKAERNYSQIEKEGLALIFGVKKFHIYLYGRKKFTLVTDHKPLLAILGPKNGFPPIVAARLQRWAVILAAYSYDLQYHSSTKIGNADALSRLPIEEAPISYESNVMMINNLAIPITAKEIAEKTKQDPNLSRILQGLISGHNTISNKEEFRGFSSNWSELFIESGCIMRGARVVIPKALQKQVLQEIHADHLGIVKSKAIARSYVWWPGIDKDIETFVKNCQGCNAFQNNPQPVRLHPWEYPTRAWQRLHLDFAGPFLGHHYLIVVDAYSKWPEVIPMSSITSYATIKVLMNLFATHGLPERIFTDNGSSFVSEEFRNFLDSNGISHTTSSPYHPSSNGEAERFVQTFKHNMKCRGATQANVVSNINKFLLQYRATDHASTGQSPSFLLMGRRVRTKLDLMVPNFQAEQINKGFRKMENLDPVRQFVENQAVMVRMYNDQVKWVPGIIKRKLGHLHYEVEVQGVLQKRHVDQLRSQGVEENGKDKDNPDSPPPAVENAERIDVTERSKSGRSNRGIPPDRLDL